ncbi:MULTISPECIES: hypothetical protein [Pseudomonas]|uniref:hypothetical protein n=1 Tax=Pseudomonas TaxID=286 RepID=UPI00054C5EC8|nr:MULTISPECIES: hypothetical protein [Pseudomonas]NMX82835.1 hypothetical protein [Pseudomonas sp. WS 5503]
MTSMQKLVGLGLAAILVSLLGVGGGVWLSARHYRPLLDVSNASLVKAALARDNLEALAVEQGRKLGDLVQAGHLRERNAALAQEKARQESQPDYAAANKLLRERTGGDPAEAAGEIIDVELGL